MPMYSATARYAKTTAAAIIGGSSAGTSQGARATHAAPAARAAARATVYIA